VTTEDLGQIADAISSNGQVWDASSIPEYVADFVDRVPPHVHLEGAPWSALRAYLEKLDRASHFDVVWDALVRRGVTF
jgi:hypothetical protein